MHTSVYVSWASFAAAALFAGVYTALLFVGRASARRLLFGSVLALAAGGGVAATFMQGAAGWREVATWLIGAGWFASTLPTLALPRGLGPRLALGDVLPPLRARLVTGEAVDERVLLAHAPYVLILFRGQWCPFCVAQLGELQRAHERLRAAGLTSYALSTETPHDLAPLARRLGPSVTLLSDESAAFLEALGVRMSVPWYDRVFFRARNTDMAMPLTLVVDKSGHVVFLYRSRSVDDRPTPEQLIAHAS